MGWHKYKAKKTEFAGMSFASKGEAALYGHLKLLEAANEIKYIQCQVSVSLTDAKIIYKPDFKAFDLRLNQWVWFEFKGFETDVWRIKRRLWMHYGPGILRIFKGSAARVSLYEEIIPK